MDPYHAGLIVIYLLIGLGIVGNSPAEAATHNSLSYQVGSDFRTGEKERNIITFTSLTKTDDNHIFYASIDAQSFDNSNSSTITRFLGQYRLTKSIPVSVSGQLINQAKVSSTDVGLAFNFPIGYVSGINLFKHSDNILGEGEKVFAYWVYPINEKWRFNGFVETTWANRMQASDMTLAQPELMYSMTNRLQIGMEYQFYRNKNGIKGLDETIPQFKLTYNF